MWLIIAAVILLDQMTKYWAVQALGSGHTITVVEDFLQLAYAENRGGAASLMSSHPQLLTLLSLLALGVIIWWARTVPPGDRITRAGFALVLGGATGNLLDRLFRGGFFFDTYVVDFVDAHWYHRIHWPTFNLADSAICLGIVLIFYAHFRLYRREPVEAQAAGAAAEAKE